MVPVPASSTSCGNSIVNQTTMTTANSTHEPTPASLCMNNYSYNQMASRWESRGLDRQKSLELAANFEMNMFFLEHVKQFLRASSFQFFDQMNMHSSKIEHQLEANHREFMDMPEMEKLQNCREQIWYSLVNVKIMTRCLLLAFTARFYPFLRHMPTLITSPSSAFSVVISNLCPECIIPTEQRTITMTSYLGSYFASELWGALILLSGMLYRMFAVACLGICHRFVSRSLCYAILAIMFVPWKALFMTFSGVLAINISLTLWMIRNCKNAESTMEGSCLESDKSKSTKQMIRYYSRSISRYQALVYISALTVGIYTTIDNY